MAYKGLVADNVPGIPEILFEDNDRKLSFPRGVFFDFPVDDVNYMRSSVDMRKEPHEEMDEIQTERARYLLNTDDALMEMHSKRI